MNLKKDWTLDQGVFAGEGAGGGTTNMQVFQQGFSKKGFKENGHFQKKPNGNEQSSHWKEISIYNYYLQLQLGLEVKFRLKNTSFQKNTLGFAVFPSFFYKA